MPTVEPPTKHTHAHTRENSRAATLGMFLTLSSAHVFCPR